MKYKLRFFINPGTSHSDENMRCFATIHSEHVPKRGQLIFISDDSINWSGAGRGIIYRVLYSVFCFDDPGDEKEGCNSVEVVVRETNI